MQADPPKRRLVVHGATLVCSQGISPSTLLLTRTSRTDNGLPIATVDDHQAMSQVLPFGLCVSTRNPSVQSATASAGGVLTPAPCTPMLNQRWSGGSSQSTIDGAAALTSSSTLACQWGGTISIVAPNTKLGEL